MGGSHKRSPLSAVTNPTPSFQLEAAHYGLAFQYRGHFLVLITGHQTH